MLTEEELRAIRSAAEEAYDKLRWIVGDSENLLAELHILARDLYCAGKRSIALPEAANPEAANSEKLCEALKEIRSRLVENPMYAALTEDEELEIGGETGELSYLVRVADAVIEPQKNGDGNGN